MSLLKKVLDGKRGILLKNTVMLYILQFSTYLLALAVAPYQTRVLGPEVFGGILEASVSIVIYFQFVIDFGFLLSATEEVSRERANRAHLCKVFTSVTYAKLALAACSFVVLVVLCQLIPAWKQKETILILTFLASFINSMIPDFLYRGLEKMSAITIRTVLIKIFFTATIFIFLKKPEDVWIIPVLNIIGNGVAMIFAYIHVIKKLNDDESIDGILLQHPVPRQIDERLCFNSIIPSKDVDGVNSASFGKMAMDRDAYVSATPYGIIRLLKHYNIEMAGKHAVVVGRSAILGKPMAMLLLKENCTVTVCHSRTENLPEIVKTADIVVGAVGKPRFIQKDWLKEGVVLVDAGYNAGNVGDIDLENAKDIASAYTPVPGGVGPMTINTLMLQTIDSASKLVK